MILDFAVVLNSSRIRLTNGFSNVKQSGAINPQKFYRLQSVTMARRLTEIPDYIRHVHEEIWFPRTHYLNAFERLPATETRLYGTETMYGDWNARILLLLQDWCNSQLLEDRISENHCDPWSHKPDMKTNNLLRCGFGPEGSPGLLYASALAHLLKKRPNQGALPPRFKVVLPFLAKVMNFTFANLPRVQVVVCFGRYAERVLLKSDCVLDATSLDKVRNTLNPVTGFRPDGRPLRIFAFRHPSRGYSNASFCKLANVVKSP